MPSLRFLVPLLVMLPALAQDAVSSAFTEPTTGITLQTTEHTNSGMKFGFALPPSKGKDLIGFISGDVEAAPWAGTTLGGTEMLHNILITAFPYSASDSSTTNANCKVPIGDVRVATGYRSNDIKLYAGSPEAPVQVKPIRKGVFMKDNKWQYMFLCQNCLANSSLAFNQNEEKVELIFVVGPQTPTVHTYGASLTEHTGRSLQPYSLNISASKSKDFDRWAAMAEAPEKC